MMPPASISGLCPANWPAWRSPLDLCTRHSQLHTIVFSFSHFKSEIPAGGMLWMQLRDQSFRDPVSTLRFVSANRMLGSMCMR
eukprot:m.854359 g.854359  ORF g.854359 m.854359 type:complete len:83 (-) comp59619_c0_seq12:10-258(-)